MRPSPGEQTPGADAARAPHVWLAEPHEAETVAALLVAFRDSLGYDWPSANSFLAGVEKLLDDPGTEYVLGAPHDDAPPAAVAQLRFRHGLWRAGGDCLIEDLYVAPQARRSGLARATMLFALERASERGCRRAELDVNERNAPALALYEGLGFSAGANPYGGRDLYMRLHLDAGDDD
jgi:ribosomal protein S18 acetylase RimI-like enzyme